MPLHQPTHREPLLPRLVERGNELGAIGLSFRVTLWLVGGDERRIPFRFVVDSGSSYSTISLSFAEARGLMVPPPEADCEVKSLTTEGESPMLVRPGRIRGWWNREERGHPFDWPVLFRVRAPEHVPPVLGLGGVVKTCRWIFDGRSSSDSPYGYLTFEDIR